MKKPRHHHYVPRFYLGGFADADILARDKKEVIWVYEKGKDVRRSSPENEAKQRDYYAFVENDSRRVEVEEWFGGLEAIVAPIISNLAQNPRHITDSERQILAVFIGTMQMRTPSGRYLSDMRTEPLAAQLIKEAASDPARFRAFAEENRLLTEGTGEFDLEEIRHGILSGRSDEIAAREDTKLFSIIEIGKMVAEVLLNMSWQTICSGERDSFLISDDPVIAHVIDQRSNKLHLRMGVATPGANVWFPLCRTICLRIVKGDECGFGQWVPAGIRFVNKMTMMCAERWVYASERSEKIKSLFDKKGGQCSVKTVDFRFEGRTY
jgi:Protein of unknown function (DUF4238)